MLLLIYLLVCKDLQNAGFRINLSASMPVGLYRRVDASIIHRGDWVSVCLPNLIAHEGLKKGYLLFGQCSSGVVPVLKQVIAVPKDNVLLSDCEIQVNDEHYFAPIQTHDHQGKWVHRFVEKGRYWPIKNYWLYGLNDPMHSWDSRYYGGIPRNAIQGIYRPLFVFLRSKKLIRRYD